MWLDLSPCTGMASSLLFTARNCNTDTPSRTDHSQCCHLSDITIHRLKMFFIARQYCRYRQKWIKNVSTKTIRLELAESCTLIYWACFYCWKRKEKKKSPKKEERSRATLETAMKSCWHWLATNRAERRRTEASVAKGRGGYWSVKPWQRD